MPIIAPSKPQNAAADKSIARSQQYESHMKIAIDKQAGAQIAGMNADADQAIGGYQEKSDKACGYVLNSLLAL